MVFTPGRVGRTTVLVEAPVEAGTKAVLDAPFDVRQAGGLGVVMVSLVLPDAASPLGKDGYLVVPTGFGVVSCLEAKTGRVLWERDFDRGFWSSPIAVDDRVYLIATPNVLAALALGVLAGGSQAPGPVRLVGVLLVVGYPIFDITFVTLIRLAEGRSILLGGKEF